LIQFPSNDGAEASMLRSMLSIQD